MPGLLGINTLSYGVGDALWLLIVLFFAIDVEARLC